ncbi:hypothetical protein [Gordonia sp. SL306]|uniref:hypothetical protein n=1 Tax=Gordonia sp. SL306 TaxID=2995145 RepID=UPI00226E0C7F|nr:hypothetical protein [Gordonia sp. SL306]WAC57231.1 hypothetical protein OVA31_08345 [Gordonia sp. SL306]
MWGQRLSVSMIAVAIVTCVTLSFGGENGLGAVASAAPIAPHSDSRTTSRSTEPKECVGSRFATFGAIYDAIFDSLKPYLPQEVQQKSASIKAGAHRDMARLRISSLAVSNHPYDLGADDKDPIMKYRDPISQWVVTQLVAVRDGRAGEAIPVENLTLAQAVESVWLYLYVTVMVPLTVLRRTLPSIGPLAGPITIGTLITLPILLGVFAATQLYKSISEKLVDSCVVSVTRSQKANAGKSVKDLRFAYAVPGIVRDIAGQVAVADADTCKPIGDLPLTRIVTRTSDYLQSITANPATDRQIAGMTTRLQDYLRTTRVHQNLIPADPADFNTPEYILSQVGVLIPYVGGAPLDVVIGLSHNRNNKQDFAATVPMSDLTVTKSLTAAYYAYALAAHMVELAWQEGGTDPAAALANDLFPGLGITTDMLPKSTGIVGAPNLYGLVVYHNVLRSMCLAEDKRPAPAPTSGKRVPVSAARW